MDLEKLQLICTCFIVGGLTIPAFDVIMGMIGGAMELNADVDADLDLDVDADLDLDVDMDIGDVGAPAGHGGGPVTVNLMTLSFMAVVFGAVGKLTLRYLPVLPALLVAALLGLLGGFLIGRYIIRPLKRNRSLPGNIYFLKGHEGTVKLELRKDFVGTISVTNAAGCRITYSAKPMDGIEKIPVGTLVRIVAVDGAKQICVVLPLE